MKIHKMKAVCLLVFVFFAAICSQAQIVVGTYYGTGGNRYQVLVDGMRFRVPIDQLSRSQKKDLYLQVEVESKTPGVFTYLRMRKSEAVSFVNKISGTYVKGQKMMQKSRNQRAVVGKGNMFISYVRADSNISTNPVFGWNQGNQYTVVYEKGNMNPVLTFDGEQASSEGEYAFSIDGWKLTISSPEQANDLIQLLMSGVKMIDQLKKEK